MLKQFISPLALLQAEFLCLSQNILNIFWTFNFNYTIYNNITILLGNICFSFIKSIIYYVKNYHIDGIDLDWEFPNEHPGYDKRQKLHFTQLLEEIRHTIDKQEPKYKFLLTVAVAAPYFIVENSYEVSYMNQ